MVFQTNTHQIAAPETICYTKLYMKIFLLVNAELTTATRSQ